MVKNLIRKGATIINLIQQLLVFLKQPAAADLERVKKCIGLLEAPFQLLTSPQHRLEDYLKDQMVVITFGKPMALLAEQFIQEQKYTSVIHLGLPEASTLRPEPKNEATRKEVLAKIKQLKTKLSEATTESKNVQPVEIKKLHEIVITKDDLPDLSRRHLLMLEKLTEQQHRTSCFQVARNGKLIEISRQSATTEENQQSSPKVDLYLSFEEIYTLTSVMDVLDTEEVKLVFNNTAPAIGD